MASGQQLAGEAGRAHLHFPSSQRGQRSPTDARQPSNRRSARLPPRMNITSSQALMSWRAQFNFRFIMYPRVFSVGKLSLSFKFQKQRNYERNYWVNTLMPIMFCAARDPDQHPVWNYLYQERKALLIPLLPTLAMTHLAHDLPYQRSTIITKLKEPTVLLTKKSCSARVVP